MYPVLVLVKPGIEEEEDGLSKRIFKCMKSILTLNSHKHFCQSKKVHAV